VVSCEFSQKPPTIAFVQTILSGIISSKKRREVHGKRVLEVVSEFYGITPDDLISKGRKKTVVVPRQVAMYLMRNELDMSYPTIGDEFGGRDHTTALHAFEKIEQELVHNSKLQEDVTYLREKIYSL
jgi:chromosomal replication initiator protein